MNALAFFKPFMLWAILFTAVPLLIHFFQRRRTIRFSFSSLRFLRETAITASRRKRLRRLLLLLVRCAVIVILAFLFAQPYSRRDPFGILRDPQGQTCVWVDPTISMDYRRDDGRALWQIAGEHTAVLDSTRAPGRKILVFDNCRTRFLPRPETLVSPCDGVRHGETSLHTALREFIRIRAEGARLPALFLFSDFQTHETAVLDTFLLSAIIDFPILCVNMAQPHPFNYSAAVVSSPDRHHPYVKCRITSRGRTLPRSEVSVLSGSLRIGHAQVECPRDTFVDIDIEVSERARSGPGRISLDAADPFMHDNEAYFVSDSRTTVRVVILSDGEECFPISAALRSLSPAYAYEPRIVKPQEATFDHLDSADCIILNALSLPSTAVQALFTRRSLAKKTVIFSPGIGSEYTAFNNEVFRHCGLVRQTEIRRSAKPLFPVLSDTVSALWRGFPRMMDRTAVIDAYLAPIAGDPILRLSDGGVLAAFSADSAGHCWIISAVPLGIDETNNLAETGFYVPLIDRLVRFGLAAVRAEKKDWVAGCLEHNPYFGGSAGAEVFDADNNPVARWNGQPLVAFDKPGVYRVQPRDEAGYWAAAQCASEEGGLSYRKPVSAKNIKRFIRIIDSKEYRAFIAAVHGSSRINILWIVLGILLIVEICLWPGKQPGVSRANV